MINFGSDCSAHIFILRMMMVMMMIEISVSIFVLILLFFIFSRIRTKKIFLIYLNSLNIYFLHRLKNKFLQFILIYLDSASWELHQYSRRMCGPMKNPKVETLRTQIRNLMIARPTLYPTTTEATIFDLLL